MPAQAYPVPAWRRMRQWLPFVALVTAALFSIWRVASATTPLARDWAVAADIVTQRWHADDAAVVAPSWLVPVARVHIGQLGDVTAAARMDLATAPRAWLVSPLGHEADGVTLLRSAGFAANAPVFASRAGALVVQLFEQQPAVMIDHLLAHVTGVVAEVGEAQGRGYAPKRCALLVPPAGGQTEMLVEMTLGSQLVGYVGLADVFTRRDIRAPGILRIELVTADGTRTPLVQQAAGVDDGWVRFAAPTLAGKATLAFIAQSPSPAGRDRRICFQAEARQ